MLSGDEIRHLSSGKGGAYEFDLSKIRHTNFEPLMKGLETFGIHSIHTLTFTIELKTNFSKAEELKSLINYSIAAVVPKYFKRLCLLCKRMLEKSQILKEIRFIGIKVPKKELKSLAPTLTKPSCLELMEFKDVHIEDSDVNDLFKEFGSAKIPNLFFTNCELTDEATENIVSYLNKYTARNGIKKKAPKIRLPENHLSEYCEKQILIASGKMESSDGYYYDEDEENIEKSSMANMFIEAGPPIEPVSVENAEENGLDSKTAGKPAVFLDPSFQNFFGGEAILTNFGDSPDQLLMAENQKLRIMIDRLKSMIREVNEHDALFIVGDGVYDVAEFMKAIEMKINEMVV